MTSDLEELTFKKQKLIGKSMHADEVYQLWTVTLIAWGSAGLLCLETLITVLFFFHWSSQIAKRRLFQYPALRLKAWPSVWGTKVSQNSVCKLSLNPFVYRMVSPPSVLLKGFQPQTICFIQGPSIKLVVIQIRITLKWFNRGTLYKGMGSVEVVKKLPGECWTSCNHVTPLPKGRGKGKFLEPRRRKSCKETNFWGTWPSVERGSHPKVTSQGEKLEDKCCYFLTTSVFLSGFPTDQTQ